MSNLKKILLTLSLLLSVCPFLLADTEYNNALVLELQNGTSYTFQLVDKPVISFTSDSVVIESNSFKTSLQYGYIEIRNISFSDFIPAFIMNDVQKHIRYKFLDGKTFIVYGIDEHAQISVYSLDGKSMPVDIERSTSEISIHLNNINEGFYIIRVNNQSYKIYKL